jgi:hypothetical protein
VKPALLDLNILLAASVTSILKTWVASASKDRVTRVHFNGNWRLQA